MANGYMPRQDVAALAWMRTFAGGLGAGTAIYHVTAQEVQVVRSAVEAFGEALMIASEPQTRTSVAIRRKDAARMEAEDACRPVYARVRADKTINDSDKLAIGVRPMKATYARSSAPDTAPLLLPAALSWSAYEIAYKTGHGPTERAKPAGADYLQVFRVVGDAPALSPEQASYYRGVSRSPMRVAYTSADNGKVITYFARWVSRRGEVGPWSKPLSVRSVSSNLLMPNLNHEKTASAA